MNPSGHNVFTFGPFRLSPDEATLTRDGQPLSLTPKEFDTLLALVEAQGRLVKKEELLSRVWPDSYVGDGSLARNVSVLRKALGDDVIETIPRRGYRIAIPVSRLSPGFECPDTTAPAESPVQPVRPDLEASNGWRKQYVIAASIAGLILITLITLGLRSRRPTIQSSAPHLVLVADLEDRAGVPIAHTVFEEDVQREIRASHLANVVPPERVQQVLVRMRKPANTVLTATIAREICLRDGDIAFLISGRLEKLETRYVLSSDLLDPVTNTALFTQNETVDKTDDIPAAARKLAEHLRQAVDDQSPHLTAHPQKLSMVTTSSLHALELYSSADELLAQNQGASPTAVDMLQEAIEI